jgi:hypothetical protein
MHGLQNHSSVCKQFLDSLEGILFFGTPVEGMCIEHLVAMVGNNANRSFLVQLRAPSDTFTSLKRQFRQAFTSPDIQIYSFYEMDTTPIDKETQGKDWSTALQQRKDVTGRKMTSFWSASTRITQNSSNSPSQITS